MSSKKNFHTVLFLFDRHQYIGLFIYVFILFFLILFFIIRPIIIIIIIIFFFFTIIPRLYVFVSYGCLKSL